MTQSTTGKRNMMEGEGAQAVVSYITGSGIAVMALLNDLATVAQALAVILGCCIVIVRLIHDGINLYDRIKNGPRK